MREYVSGCPLVFNHVPKTAGTSLTAALRQALDPAKPVHGMDRSLSGGMDQFGSFSTTARQMMFLSPGELPSDADLVAGHFAPSTTRTRYPRADHVTFLRNPRARMLSQWLHSRSLTEFDIRHWGPGADGFRACWLPLAHYLENPVVAANTDNTMARFLTWPHPLVPAEGFIDPDDDAEILAAAKARIDEMDYVDVVENPTFLRDLAAWLGRDLSEARLNERLFTPRRRRPDLDAELAGAASALDARTRIDLELWRYVAGRSLPGQDLDVVVEESLARTVARYVASFANPAPSGRPVRRIVAFAYNTFKRPVPLSRTLGQGYVPAQRTAQGSTQRSAGREQDRTAVQR